LGKDDGGGAGGTTTAGRAMRDEKIWEEPRVKGRIVDVKEEEV
jgi:hypothetical protein